MDILNNFSDLGDSVFGEGGATVKKIPEGFCVTNRKFKYSSLAAHINRILGDCEAYESRFVLKCSNGSLPVAVYHKIIIEYIGLEYTLYDCGKTETINDENFTEIKLHTDIPSGAQIKDVIAYFIQGTCDNFCDITVKEFESVSAKSPEKISAICQKDAILPQKNLTFGVIRWDAYSETGLCESNPSDQVARALSPNEFHFAAPFFSQFMPNGNIKFGKADQERFDAEASLAIRAGIDYFAYCWYKNSDTMCYARRQHIKSKFADKIKMCAIIGVSSLDDDTLSELAENMQENCYLKFDSRPVVYVYDAFKNNNDVEKLIKITEKADLPTPYFIGMVSKANPFTVNTLIQNGMDAMSAYSFSSLTPNEPFNDFAENAEKENLSRYDYADKIDIVPCISFGHDTRPRIKTPVLWANHGYGGNFTLPPGGDELYCHISNVLKNAVNTELCKPKTCLAYAWNEHDEGGYCCPTIAVDSDGQPIFDINGDVILNAFRLNAVAKAVKEVKAIE